MRRTCAAAILAAALMVVGGCGSDAAEVNTGLDGLRIGFFTNGGQTPTYVAIEEGLFREHGLEVERVEFQDPAAMTAALQRGDIDLMSSIPGLRSPRGLPGWTSSRSSRTRRRSTRPPPTPAPCSRRPPAASAPFRTCRASA